MGPPGFGGAGPTCHAGVENPRPCRVTGYGPLTRCVGAEGVGRPRQSTRKPCALATTWLAAGVIVLHRSEQARKFCQSPGDVEFWPPADTRQESGVGISRPFLAVECQPVSRECAAGVAGCRMRPPPVRCARGGALTSPRPVRPDNVVNVCPASADTINGLSFMAEGPFLALTART